MIYGNHAGLTPPFLRHAATFQMTPVNRPSSASSCVKSGFVLRRLALRRILEWTTVFVMTQHKPAALQSGIEWEALFHSYHPLRIRYAPGEMICQAGSYVAGVHLIVGGAVSDTMLAIDGEHRNCDILGPGDLIGLEILESHSDGLSISLCRALTAVELLFIEKNQLESALDDNPVLQRALFRYAVSRVVFTRKDPRQQTSVEAQLCRLLLRLAEACGLPAANGGIVLPVEITLRMLGELLCISPRQFRHARQAIQSLETNDSGLRFDVDEARRMINNECPSTV